MIGAGGTGSPASRRQRPCRPADTDGRGGGRRLASGVLATLTGTVPFATIALNFDPIVRLGDNGVRLETLGLTAAAVVALVVAAFLAGRTAPDHHHTPAWARSEDAHLRRDDLLFIVLGIVPGAVVGGRLGYLLLHGDFYAANQSAILDAGQGSLELGLAVVAGTLTGAYVASLLEAPIGRWLHVAAAPTLAGLALGKVAMALGGSGQGAPSEAGWSTAYVGPGPWGSLAPWIPAHPAQLYEAATSGLALIVLVALLTLGAFRARDGSAFFVGLGLWATGRFAVTFTWRDDAILGPLRAGGLIAIGVVVWALVGIALARWAAARVRYQAHEMAASPEWPDPATRPPF
jgi:phosphatidylglycerol---prolipoprotein diacylglyceryl transferase